MTPEERKAAALSLDTFENTIQEASTEDKIAIVREYLDLQIGTEAKAEISRIDLPGPVDLEGELLERVSDGALGILAGLIVSKGWLGTGALTPEGT